MGDWHGAWREGENRSDLFTQEILIKCLVEARQCARPWRLNREQDDVPVFLELTILARNNMIKQIINGITVITM